MVKKLVLLVFIVLVIGLGYYFISQPSKESLKAPGKDWESAKKVEDYFIERFHMPVAEAEQIRSKPGVDGKANLRLDPKVTLDALIGNLFYYGFIRDEKAFRYALEHTKDTTPNELSIKVGKNGTIDTNAEYRISENMSAWEMADLLLNKPEGHFAFDEYGYFFMP
jgi:hypothetical protein